MHWRRRAWRAGEFVVLFVVVPALMTVGILPLYVIPSLVGGALLCVTVLLMDRTFDRSRLWGARRAARGSGVVFGLFAVGAAALTVLAFLVAPERIL
jgi:hypothetical protein